MKYFIRMLTVWLRCRRSPRLHIDEVCRTPLRVNVGDLDIYRHMNNGTYLTIADLGRYEWMLRTRTWSTIGRRGWYPVVTASTTTYRKSLQLGQRFVLETRLLGADERAFYLEHRFVVAGQMYARTMIRGRFVGPEGGLPISRVIEALPELGQIPQRVPAWTERWAEDTKLPPTRADAASVWEDERPHL